MVRIAATSFIFAAVASTVIASPTFGRAEHGGSCRHTTRKPSSSSSISTDDVAASASSGGQLIVKTVTSWVTHHTWTTAWVTPKASATEAVSSSIEVAVTPTSPLTTAEASTTSSTVEVAATTSPEAPAVEHSSSSTSSTEKVTTTEATSTQTTAKATTTQATTASSNTQSSDIAAYLSGHNTLRAAHGASALVWNDTLATAAQSWSNKCDFEHSGGSLGPYGENLAAGTGNYPIASGIAGWANEASEYNPSNPQFSHFTQMVWKATTQLGCALTTCNPGTIFDASYGATSYYVCEYFPQGNVIGQFAEEVQA